MDIVQIVSSYGIQLKKVGGLYIGLCPFHNDKNNPNLTLYIKTNTFHCFSCKISGDIYRFIALMEGISVDQVKTKYRYVLLKKKLETLGVPSAVDFKEEIQMIVSKTCYAFLNSNPTLLDDVMQVLQKLDSKMLGIKHLSYVDGIKLVEKLRHYLYNIKEMKKRDTQITH